MREHEERKEPRSQSEPKLPRGHFSEDGLSQGKRDGAVRPTPDACNERDERDERKEK